MKRVMSLMIRYTPRSLQQRLGHILAKILSVFYQGSVVECPICLHRFRKFLPYGREGRDNALCPNCLSLERHRLIWLYLKQRTDFFTHPQKMLHVAPEYCFINRFKEIDSLNYITADIESPLADYQLDVHQLPFETASFDCLMCNHVLEHVRDDRQVMRELLRVLKPGGWAILQVPFFEPVPEITYEDPAITASKERYKAFGQEDHLRMYGRDYGKILQGEGFEVYEDMFVQNLALQQVERYALHIEPVYFCKKP